jgi:hypothetical protein
MLDNNMTIGHILFTLQHKIFGREAEDPSFTKGVGAAALANEWAANRAFLLHGIERALAAQDPDYQCPVDGHAGGGGGDGDVPKDDAAGDDSDESSSGSNENDQDRPGRKRRRSATSPMEKTRKTTAKG